MNATQNVPVVIDHATQVEVVAVNGAVKALDDSELALIAQSCKGEQSAKKGRAVVRDLLVAHGIHSKDLTPKGDHVEIYQKVESAIAAGIFTAREFALWSIGAKGAKAKGGTAPADRNLLTKQLSGYIGAMRAMLDTAWGEKKERAAPVKAEKEEGADAGDAGDDAEQVAKIGTIDPSKDVESFIAGLNTMIVACNVVSGLKKAQRARYVQVLQAIASELVA